MINKKVSVLTNIKSVFTLTEHLQLSVFTITEDKAVITILGASDYSSRRGASMYENKRIQCCNKTKKNQCYENKESVL